MKTVIEDIRKKLREGAYGNEEHVRLSLVTRLLLELGWDVWNPQEVNSEFVAVRHEDSTRVDLALFPRAYSPPSVFMEIKAVGKLVDISRVEIQLRDYNRNNTAMFSIITDGQTWRFYYSQAGGEFSTKCFKTLDLLVDELDELEITFRTFLSKSEIVNGNSKHFAEEAFQSNQKQRVIEKLLPKAHKMVLEPPYPSLPQALIELALERGFPLTEDEIARCIVGSSTKESRAIDPSSIPTITNSRMATPHAPSMGKRSAKSTAKMARLDFVRKLQEQGVKLVAVRGVTYRTAHGGLVGIAFATESNSKWFLGLPIQDYDFAVLQCLSASGEVRRFVIPRPFFEEYKDKLSRSSDQYKFHITAEGKAYYITIPSVGPIEINQYADNIEPFRSGK